MLTKHEFMRIADAIITASFDGENKKDCVDTLTVLKIIAIVCDECAAVEYETASYKISWKQNEVK